MSIKKILRKIFPDQQAKRVRPWFMADGDRTLRLDYPLSQNSIVLDLGGYEGQWTSDIFSMYQCNVLVFEPFKPFAEKIVRRFRHNEKIKVFDFGLSKTNESKKIFFNKDSTSAFRGEGESTIIELRQASSFLKSNGVEFIDLMKINIEGGEYDLLEELISSGWCERIQNIQVQFHDFVPDAAKRMGAIQASLSKTHSLTYQYEFVWENWEKKQ